MSPWLLLVVAGVYVWVGLDYALSGRYGMALAWVAYAAANIGFALDAVR